jgi:hypothetical protein
MPLCYLEYRLFHDDMTWVIPVLDYRRGRVGKAEESSACATARMLSCMDRLVVIFFFSFVIPRL